MWHCHSSARRNKRCQRLSNEPATRIAWAASRFCQLFDDSLSWLTSPLSCCFDTRSLSFTTELTIRPCASMSFCRTWRQKIKRGSLNLSSWNSPAATLFYIYSYSLILSLSFIQLYAFIFRQPQGKSHNNIIVSTALWLFEDNMQTLLFFHRCGEF